MCVYLCDDVAFVLCAELGLTAVENTTIGHISVLEEPPLRVSDVKHKAHKDLWEGTMKAEFKGLVDLNVAEFIDVNIVSARWVLPGRWIKMTTW